MKKKFRSRWFRVAVEGATTDGRQIERQWLLDAAETYDPKTYGARVWLEHFRSLYADGPFKAYGDVLALKTEEVEIAGTKKLALFAQIEPTDELVAMVNKAKQKIFTSIEISPKFADSGRAYLSGLAVTDTPASLGTEMLTFAAQNPDASPLKARKQHADNLFTAAEETALEFDEVDDKPGIGAVLLSKVHGLLKRNKDQADTDFANVAQAVEDIAEHVKDLPEQYAQSEQRVTQLSNQVQTLQTELADLKTKLGNTADHHQQQRPPVTGGGDRIKTDC
ncbi:GPO family capsid scaffolding protein [Pseudomonas sp. AN-1]|uniref:GPO family capsid scaffolding protein n=1 Tax=Pseudomonas sp. AN-1 TaxID=3096605 RepID=UPI002A6B068C|nr:GPO family capsid scaffolding protein [Pseudomonas sp. AN-1]WPP47720.1 GPO family capsid scaffolding protein [Pseudomonas sp. AN-1]